MKRFCALLMVIALLLVSMSALAEYEVGQIVTFGSYEQDNIPENGKEPIEWIVVKVSAGEATLVSVKALDARPFAASWAAFGSSTLRKWLNDTFLTEAFCADEVDQLVIQPAYNIYVSLPSYKEADSLLQGLGVVTCEATPYAISRGADTNGLGRTAWWVREHPYYKCSCINAEGNIQAGNVWPTPKSRLGVRPMICVRDW